MHSKEGQIYMEKHMHSPKKHSMSLFIQFQINIHKSSCKFKVQTIQKSFTQTWQGGVFKNQSMGLQKCPPKKKLHMKENKTFV